MLQLAKVLSLSLFSLTVLAVEQAHAQACSPGVLDDAPDCPGFQDDRTWDPSGDLLTVAEQTARHPGDTSDGVSESLVNNGGKPFWQMRWGFTSSSDANNVGTDNPAYWGALQRQAWCSETVSFWHREAQLPFDDGYRTDLVPSWRLNGSGGLQEWYAGQEALHILRPSYPARGIWLDDDELDLSASGGVPGYDLPCPGAYQRLVEYDGVGAKPWEGVHSQVVYEMTIHEDVWGQVCQVDLVTIDGNISNTTKVSPTVRTIPDDLQGHGLATVGRVAIDGWGIDQVQVGGAWVPSCDNSRITWVSGVCYPPPHISSSLESLEWVPFLTAVYDYGIEYHLDGASWWDDRLPQPSVGNTWVLPGASFADGVGIFEVEWPVELAFPTQELELELDTPDLSSLVVYSLDDSGTVLATSASHTSLAQPRIWVEMDSATQPSILRFVLGRSATTDVEVLDLMAHPDTEDDQVVYP